MNNDESRNKHQRGLSWSSLACLGSSLVNRQRHHHHQHHHQEQPRLPPQTPQKSTSTPAGGLALDKSCTPLTPSSSKSAVGLARLLDSHSGSIIAKKLNFDNVEDEAVTLDGLCRRVSKLSINHRRRHINKGGEEEEEEEEEEEDDDDDDSNAIINGRKSCRLKSKVEKKTPHCALTIPEIVHEILFWVEAFALIPYEPPPVRRRPLSYQHALLIHGDEQVARRAWIDARQEEVCSGPDTYKRYRLHPGQHCLYNSLLVCRLWYDIGQPLLYRHIHLCTSKEWNQFIRQVVRDKASSLDLGFDGTGNCKDDLLHHRGPKAKLLILHKIADARQDQIELLNHIGNELEWLEFYTCPTIIPTPQLLRGGLIRRLVLPGCDGVNDRFLSMVAHSCPRLEILDIRACNLVSDRGIASISRHCPQLTMLNVGRTSCGERITTRGVKYLVRRTKIDTLGLAGCYITDEAIWEIVRFRARHIQRLSLNHCYLLSDGGIPQALKFFTNLTVLELRSCIQITDMAPIVEFKFKHSSTSSTIPLIEGCEIFESRMREAEWRYHFGGGEGTRRAAAT